MSKSHRMTKEEFTIEIAREYFAYDEITGVVTRTKDVIDGMGRIRARAGDICNRVAGCYYKTSLYGLSLFVHQLAFFLKEGRWSSNQMDHIDRNGFNNVWTNLREATRSENAKNCSLHVDSTTGYPCISWHKPTNKFQFTINNNEGKQKHIGLYKTLEEALFTCLAAEQCLDRDKYNKQSPAFLYCKPLISHIK